MHTNNVITSGYFQTELYVKEIKSIIKQYNLIFLNLFARARTFSFNRLHVVIKLLLPIIVKHNKTTVVVTHKKIV